MHPSRQTQRPPILSAGAFAMFGITKSLGEDALDGVPRGLGERVSAEGLVSRGKRAAKGFVDDSISVVHGCFLSLSAAVSVHGRPICSFSVVQLLRFIPYVINRHLALPDSLEKLYFYQVLLNLCHILAPLAIIFTHIDAQVCACCIAQPHRIRNVDGNAHASEHANARHSAPDTKNIITIMIITIMFCTMGTKGRCIPFSCTNPPATFGGGTGMATPLRLRPYSRVGVSVRPSVTAQSLPN